MNAPTIDTADTPVLDARCGHPDCKGKGHYFLAGRCFNCGIEYQMKLTRGHEAPTLGAECAHCGCYRVKAQ